MNPTGNLVSRVSPVVLRRGGPNDCFTAASMYPAGMNFLEPCRGTRTHTPGYTLGRDVPPWNREGATSKVSSGPTRKLIHPILFCLFFLPRTKGFLHEFEGKIRTERVEWKLIAFDTFSYVEKMENKIKSSEMFERKVGRIRIRGVDLRTTLSVSLSRFSQKNSFAEESFDSSREATRTRCPIVSQRVVDPTALTSSLGQILSRDELPDGP